MKSATKTGAIKDKIITSARVVQLNNPGKNSKNRYINRSFLRDMSLAVPIFM
jgi:hypothetical protein